MAYIENIFLKQDDFTLNIPKWDFSDDAISCVWGESGSGKTTLLWVIAGLFECPAFKLVVKGESLGELPAHQRKTGFVFQEATLFPHLTAAENILFPAQAKKIKKEKFQSRFEFLVSRLKISGILNKKASVLSGGEAQRVAIARALLLEPSLILFDEPFSHLDTKNKIMARQLIKELNQEFKIPFIIVTHDADDVRELCAQQILVLSSGKAVAQGPALEVMNGLVIG